MRLLGTIVFLLVAAVTCWKAVDRPVLLVSLLGGFGATAMLLPDAYVPLASGGVLGILFCLVWRWVWPRSAVVPAAPGPQDARTPENSNSPPGSTVVRTTQLGLILLGVLLSLPLCGVARAETPPQPADQSAEKPAAAPPMYRVLVPIDADKKPTGGKVYVPEPFYQELYRRAAAPAEKPQGWLILRATYRGVLAPEAGSGRLGVDTLRAQYDLQVFGRATRVRIPLRAEGANLVPDGILLDGRPIEPQWDPDSNALAFEVAEPGECRLEVALRPTMPGAGGPDGFDVAIPRVAQSRLELTPPGRRAAGGRAFRVWRSRRGERPAAPGGRSGPRRPLDGPLASGGGLGHGWPRRRRGTTRLAESPTRFPGDRHEVQAARFGRSDPATATGRRSPAAAAPPARRRSADGAGWPGVGPVPSDRLPLAAPGLGSGHPRSHVPARAAPRAWETSICRGSNCSTPGRPNAGWP